MSIPKYKGYYHIVKSQYSHHSESTKYSSVHWLKQHIPKLTQTVTSELERCCMASGLVRPFLFKSGSRTLTISVVDDAP